MTKQSKEKAPRLTGLTGSIGSGKSTVADMLRQEGALIIDADILARRAVAPGSDLLRRISDEFGSAIVDDAGGLDRTALGRIVFSDPQKREILEKIVHPRVRELFLEELARLRSDPSAAGKLIVYVVPLLFESSNRYPELEKIVVVSAPEETCIRRIMLRDGSDRELAEKKYASQMPIGEKEKRADLVIRNDSDRETLALRVKDAYRLLTS